MTYITDKIAALWGELENKRREISFQHEYNIITDEQFLEKSEKIKKEKQQVRDIVSKDVSLI